MSHTPLGPSQGVWCLGMCRCSLNERSKEKHRDRSGKRLVTRERHPESPNTCANIYIYSYKIHLSFFCSNTENCTKRKRNRRVSRASRTWHPSTAKIHHKCSNKHLCKFQHSCKNMQPWLVGAGCVWHTCATEDNRKCCTLPKSRHQHIL